MESVVHDLDERHKNQMIACKNEFTRQLVEQSTNFQQMVGVYQKTDVHVDLDAPRQNIAARLQQEDFDALVVAVENIGQRVNGFEGKFAERVEIQRVVKFKFR